jgi:hypothetical protein
VGTVTPLTAIRFRYVDLAPAFPSNGEHTLVGRLLARSRCFWRRHVCAVRVWILDGFAYISPVSPVAQELRLLATRR